MLALQPLEEVAPGLPGFGVEPGLQLASYRNQGIGSASTSFLLQFRLCGGPDLPLRPGCSEP